MAIGSRFLLCLLLACLLTSTAALAQQVNAPNPQGGNISGTVMDTDDNVITGATVFLEDDTMKPVRTAITGDEGEFAFADVRPDEPRIVTVRAPEHLPWISGPVTLTPGKFVFLTGIRLRLSGGVTSVTVNAFPSDIATQQLRAEERQRAFGIIPNFYVSYESHPAPLSDKMKFALALKLDSDPVTLVGAALFAGIDQAADTPDYGRDAQGYMQRFGATYADIVTDNIVGSALLPSLLHQDPRYFYKGSGTTSSRIAHAIEYAFVCRGDNGQLQPNYSAIGGDLAAGAVSNLYYPARNRGGGLVLQNSAIMAGTRVADGLLQEFVLRRFTTH